MSVLNGPHSIVSADFNKNGHPDLAVTAGSIQAVDLLINNGAGGFLPARATGFPSGQMRLALGRWTLAPADFDGDGNTDLVVANESSTPSDETRKVSVLFGDGSGGFAPRVTLTTPGGEANSVATADLNQDGAPDILASGRTRSTIWAILSDGAGGFAGAEAFPAGTATMNGLVVGDFDGDGLADLGTSSFPDRLAYVLLGDPNGNGDFLSPPADFSTLVKNLDGSFTRTLKEGSRFEYDTAGRLTAQIDRNGNITAYAYDAEGRLESMTDPAGGVTAYAYGANGKLASVTDTAGRIWAHVYDAEGNLTGITDVDDSVRQMAYDANGRLISELSERGFATTHDYGFAGQWTGSGFPDGASVSAQISRSLGLADLGIGLGTEGSPAPTRCPTARPP